MVMRVNTNLSLRTLRPKAQVLLTATCIAACSSRSDTDSLDASLEATSTPDAGRKPTQDADTVSGASTGDAGASAGQGPKTTVQSSTMTNPDAGSTMMTETIGDASSSASSSDASSSASSVDGSTTHETSATDGVQSTSDTNNSSGSDTSDATAHTNSSGLDSTTSVDCLIDSVVSLSPVIGTVGTLFLTTDAAQVDSGYVEFGRDTQYGLRASLDTKASDFRTLLLGMTPSTTYHYRVVLQSGDETCVGDDDSFTTAPAPIDAPVPYVQTPLPNRVFPGYVVTSVFAAGVVGEGYILMYDHHGELVWWYRTNIGPITRARLSWDGRYVYARDANQTGAPGGRVVRVSMDGSVAETINVDTGHHDMAVTPSNGVLFLTGDGRENCSTITYLSPQGTLTPFYDLRDAFQDSFIGGSDPCHCNSIDYNTADRSVSVSCLGQNAYIKLTDQGELMWVLGGNAGQSQFGGDVHWVRNHGHHFISPTRLVFYNNNGGGDSSATTSVAVELELNLTNRTATRVWEYVGGETSTTLGDVQRLKNGNTLVTYSNAKTIREIGNDLSEIQTWVYDVPVGYADHLTSLYGQPRGN
jgi:hypothetical protein